MANDALAQKAQNFTNRGRQALEAGRYDLAVELLTEALNCAPDTLETRRLLRAAQIAKYRQNPPGFMAKMKCMTMRGKVLSLEIGRVGQRASMQSNIVVRSVMTMEPR